MTQPRTPTFAVSTGTGVKDRAPVVSRKTLKQLAAMLEPAKPNTVKNTAPWVLCGESRLIFNCI